MANSELLTGGYRTTYSFLNLSLSLSYITTDGQSASLSWYQAPIWGLWPDFYYCQTIAGLSDERTVLSFTMYNVQYILLSHIWDSPNLEDQVPVFISPRNRVARLYPQALGFPFLLLSSPFLNWMSSFLYSLVVYTTYRTGSIRFSLWRKRFQ
jgi:hypothetical protein